MPQLKMCRDPDWQKVQALQVKESQLHQLPTTLQSKMSIRPDHLSLSYSQLRCKSQFSSNRSTSQTQLTKPSSRSKFCCCCRISLKESRPWRTNFERRTCSFPSKLILRAQTSNQSRRSQLNQSKLKSPKKSRLTSNRQML